MKTLSLIATEYINQAKELEDLDLPPEVIRDTLESMSGPIEGKSQAVAYVVRKLEANADAMKEWAKAAVAQADIVENRARELRDYLAYTLKQCSITKVEGPGITIGWRKSTAVDVYDPLLVPEIYFAPAPPPKPDKVAIKEALKSGVDIQGARLVERENLQIK
jgi:hypothetical protein